MKLTYDPRHNIAYLKLRDKTAEVETVQVSEEVNIDLAPNGTIYGIEMLNANELLAVDKGVLRILNEASGVEVETPLPTGSRAAP